MNQTGTLHTIRRLRRRDRHGHTARRGYFLAGAEPALVLHQPLTH